MTLNSKSRLWASRILNLLIASSTLTLIGFVSYSYLREPSEFVELKESDRLHSSLALKGEFAPVYLFLKADCKFCSSGATFYKQLSEHVRLEVLFPEDDARAQDYLVEIGLPNLKFTRANFLKVGAPGAPFLVNSDRSGKVLAIWRGETDRRKQVSIRRTLSMPIPEWFTSEDQIVNFFNSNANAVVLDVQDRDQFALNHFPNAKNVPLDELSVRAINEISLDAPIAVYGISPKDTEDAFDILIKNGFVKVRMLEYRFQNVIREGP